MLFLNCFSILNATNVEINRAEYEKNIWHTPRINRSSCVLLQTLTYRVWHRGAKLRSRTLCGECPGLASVNTMADTVAL